MMKVLFALAALVVTKTDGGMNRVATVNVEQSTLGRVVDIACEGEPVFTVFRLADPVRIVIDIARGDVSKLDGPIEVGDGVIGDIATAQFADDRHALGRLIIGLDKAFDYEVKQAGKHIRVTVRAASPVAPPLVRANVTPAAQKLAAAKLETEKAAQRKRANTSGDDADDAYME